MSDQLPRDVEIDILVRLPVNSLLRFQCVSKSWKSLIHSTDFISMHTNHNESTNNYAQYFFHRSLDWTSIECKLHHFDDSFSKFQEIEFPFDTRVDYFKKILDCKGLLLLTYTSAINPFETFILWNPAVRMSMTLPRPPIDIPNGNISTYTLGFGFDYRSNDYKVLRIVYRDIGSTIIFPPMAQLFKLSTGAWETVSVTDDFHYRIISRRSSQAFVNGATHWLGFSDSRDLVVVLFLMSDEEFRVMKLPNVLTAVEYDLISLVVSDGFLSLIVYNPVEHGYMSDSVKYNSCCIWLMKDYGIIESWTKQCTIDLRNFGGLNRTFSLRNNRVLLLSVSNRNKLVLYDSKTNRVITLGIRDMDLHSINTYTESLVLLDQSSKCYARVSDFFKGKDAVHRMAQEGLSTIKYEGNVRKLAHPFDL